MSGNVLRQLRLARGWTIEVVAEKVGISVSQVGRHETDEREPRKSEIARYADIYRVPVEVLFQPSLTEALRPKHVVRADSAEIGARLEQVRRVVSEELPQMIGVNAGSWRLYSDGKEDVPAHVIASASAKTGIPHGYFLIGDPTGMPQEILDKLLRASVPAAPAKLDL